MRNFIAAVFTSEAAAYEGLRALQELHSDGTITVYEAVVAEHKYSGEVVTTQYRQGERPLSHTAAGAVLGALAGVFGGPVGIALGGSVGFFGGALDDAIRWNVSDDYIEAIAAHAQPGSFTMIADAHESAPEAVDERVTALGGHVVREKQRELFGDLLQRRAEARRAATRRTRSASGG